MSGSGAYAPRIEARADPDLAPIVTNPLTQQLRWRDTLSVEERAVLDDLVARIRDYDRDEDIAVEGEYPGISKLILSGYAVRYKILTNGRRQIVALHIKGDFVDLHSFPLKKMDHSVAAVTSCRVALVPHDQLRIITERHPHLTRMLWMTTLIDAAIHREWMVGMGRRSAFEQLAHFICEMHCRLRLVSESAGLVFTLPLTQTDLSDTLGLSLVHVNRVVRKLRKEGLVVWRGFEVEILDWDRIREVAGFDPDYMHLESEPR